MLALTHMLDLFMDKLARCCRWSLALAQIFLRALDDSSLWHGRLLSAALSDIC